MGRLSLALAWPWFFTVLHGVHKSVAASKPASGSPLSFACLTHCWDHDTMRGSVGCFEGGQWRWGGERGRPQDVGTIWGDSPGSHYRFDSPEALRSAAQSPACWWAGPVPGPQASCSGSGARQARVSQVVPAELQRGQAASPPPPPTWLPAM